FVEYFKDLADALNSKQENWGLCAAELGNASNCRSFVDRVWFNRSEDGGGDGLMYYLKDMFDAGEGVTSRNDAPKTRTAALSAWRRARRSFHEAVAVAQKHQADKAAAREIVAQGAELEDRARTAQLALREAQLEIETLSGEAAHLEAMLERTRARHGDCDNEVSDLKTERKSSLRWCIFPTKEWKEAFADSTAAKRSARREQDRLEQEQEELHQRLARARLRREVAEAKAREVERLKKLYQDACAHLDTLGLRRHADPEFWSDTNEAIQTASPWSDEASRQARDDVFRAAVHLHKAFIDAAPYPIRHNLSLLMDHIRGRTLASDLIEYLGDLWDTFFLVVPLYSTTFASAGRMLRKMPPDSIGWLLIDEAGQAAPQSAAGALLRARRAVVMGDPLQIEPVVTLPEGIRRSLAHSYGLRADDWSGEVASCQVLADRAAKYQSFVDGRRVGFPLLVHRRCEEP
ncbi:MAG: AAA domain-containing protein, partial [Myxococcota bacterium]